MSKSRRLQHDWQGGRRGIGVCARSKYGVRLARAGNPRGFTLLELALVLALLVIIASFVWPLLRGPMSRQRLLYAGDQLRTACASARNRAIVTGETHVLRFQTGGATFEVQAIAEGDSLPPTTGTSLGSTGRTSGSRGANSTSAPAASTNQQLPEGVIFQFSETETDLRAASIDATGELAASTAAGAAPLLFFPDGTTSTSQVTLANEKGHRLTIELRGLTGITRAGSLQHGEETQQ